MLRDKALVSLSRQHQHALALCVRLERAVKAGSVDLGAWQMEIEQQFEQEISVHFAAEESEVFPAARRSAELRALVEELLAEHVELRGLFAAAKSGSLGVSELQGFGQKLAAHIRKEEQQLFQEMQLRMTADELAALGVRLDTALADAAQACAVPVVRPVLKDDL